MTALLGVRIFSRQRVSMGRGSGKAFHTATHRHIPGSVLRGALARAWIVRHGPPDAAFRRVFDGDLRYGPVLAQGYGIEPLSVRRCKYGADHCGPAYYWDAAFPPPGAADGGPLPSDWADAAGHWIQGRGDVVGPGARHMPARSVSSTAIDPGTHAAKTRQLFSRDTLDAGITFVGAVAGNRQTLAMLTDQLEGVGRLELGGRSSVMGSAEFCTTQPTEHPVPIRNGDTLILRLTSPTFLVDPAGRPSLSLEGELRRRGFAGEISVWTRSVTDGTGGFHAASRLPKPVDVGLAAGTTARLRPTPDDSPIVAAILADGLGLRRCEGFGWVEVATDPWHPAPPADLPAAAAAVEPDPASPFAALRTWVLSLGLAGETRNWFAARLLDVGTTEGPTVAEALSQPGAVGLSRRQHQIVAEVLDSELPATRRQLADVLLTEVPG